MDSFLGLTERYRGLRSTLAHAGVLLILALGAMDAFAVGCVSMSTDQDDFADRCAQIRQQVGDPQYFGRGSCTSNGVPFPSCWGDGGSGPQHLGFAGICDSEGAGPDIESTLGAGESPPTSVCVGPCRSDTTACSSVGLPDGGQSVMCQTEHSGERCVQSNSEPDPADNNPSNCDDANEIAGNCVNLQDTDSNPSAPPSLPGICIGAVCRPIPPSQVQHGCERGIGGAVCTGAPAGSTPPHPGPPWPPNQPPAFNTSAIAIPGTGQPPTRVAIYGPAGAANAGPPDGGGNCPAGSTLTAGVCICPNNGYWNGTACAAGQEPGDGSGDREASNGTCAVAPTCRGDAIDCSVVFQTWVTRCALESSAQAPEVDLAADPLAEIGGADELFTDDEVGPDQLDDGGFLGGGSCPSIGDFQVKGYSIPVPQAWCQLQFLGAILVAIAYLIAVRIVYAD